VLQSRSLIAIALAVFLGACTDTTSPDKPFTVALRLDGPPTQVITDSPDGPVITCTFNVIAQASGTGAGTWDGATTLWYFGPDHSTAVDTTTNPPFEVAQAFGADSIRSGETKHASWYLYAGAPFEAQLSFGYNYANGNSSGTATTRITCGQTQANQAIPIVTDVSVPSTTGELKIGDTVSVRYQATGASGIWMTIANITGAFAREQRFAERMATNVDRTVKFVVPSGATPNLPITISVRAYNASLQGTAKALNTQLTFIDNTPPVLGSVVVGERQVHPLLTPLAGQYAVGDSIILFAEATDNNALGWLVYELGAPANARDSVPATPGQTSMLWVTKIGVRPEWVGSPVMNVYVRDAGGLTSQTTSSPPDSLRFYPLVDHHATAPLQLSTIFDTEDMLYDAKRDLMYVAIPRDNRIVVFSPSTMTLKPAIQLNTTPAGMDLSLSGDSLLVALPDARGVAVVDLTQSTPTPTVVSMQALLDSAGAAFAGQPPEPEGLRIAANGKMIVMLIWATSAGDEAVEVDLATGAQRIRTDARSAVNPYVFWTLSMGRTPDRSRIYMLGSNCSNEYESATDSFTSCTPSVGAQGGLAFDASGSRFTTSNELLDANLQQLWVHNPLNWQEGDKLAISPDDATIYFGGPFGITAMRFADKTMMERIPIPLTAERLFVDPNGKWLLAFQNTYGGRVTRVDLQ